MAFFANNMLVARYSAVRDAMAAAVRLNFCRIIILVDSKELQWMCSCRNPCWLKYKTLQPGQLISLCYFFWSALSWMWIVMFLFPSLCFFIIWWCTETKRVAKISPKQAQFQLEMLSYVLKFLRCSGDILSDVVMP